MIQFKEKVSGWMKSQLHAAQATWLNADSLIHGLRWVEASSGQVRLQVAPHWLGRSPAKYTGSLILACELAVEEAIRLEERLGGVSLLFMGSQSEFLKAYRGSCEIRFRLSKDEMEKLRLKVHQEKTASQEFLLTLWSHEDQQIGSVTLQVRLQLQPYLTA